MRQYLLAALFSLFASAALAQGGSNICSYPAITVPLAGTECWTANQNGVTKTMTAAKLTQQGVSGPLTTVLGNFPTWNNTHGTLLADSGLNQFTFVKNVVDTVALVSLPVIGVPDASRVRVMTYNLANRQFSPAVEYYLITPSSNPNSCTVDNGSCFASTTSGYYWRITPQNIWDPRWWGAYGDVQKKTLTVAISSGNCTVVVTGGTFVTADQGKLITITNIVPSGGAYGAGYQGSISSVTDNQHITVSSPCPTFTENSTQNIYYGHDDGAARTNQTSGPINAAISFMSTLVATQQLSGQPQLNGGGLSYGTSQPIVTGNSISLANIDLVGLSSANLPIASSGVLEISCSFCTGFHVHVDAGYLPINACFANSNGTIYWSDLRCVNWMGSPKTVNATGAASINAAQFTGSIAACSGTGPYECVLTVTAVASGTIQPGQSLSDCVGGSGNNCGVNVPSGTYIDGFAANNTGSGGVGAYTITNDTTNPGVVTSETIYSLSLDLTVASCNVNNGTTIIGNLWPVNGSGTLLVGMGEVSRGNSSKGIADRTFIAGCKNGTTAVLNKAPLFNLSNQTLTFNQESNGFYMYGTATGNNYNTGLQINDLTISTESQDYVTNINTKFGCALMDDSGGGTNVQNGALSYGAAQLCFGPDSHNTIIKHVVAVSGAVGSINEINQPGMISFDGADNILLDQYEFGGQLEFFAVTGGQKDVSIRNPVVYANLGRTNLAPNNSIWFYTNQASTQGAHISIDVPQINYNNPGAVHYVIFTTSPSGSWSCFTAAQISVFSQVQNVKIPEFCAPFTIPGAGLSLGTAPLSQVEAPYTFLSGNYTLAETDSGTFFDMTGAGNIDITIPNNLAISAVTGGINPSAWYAKIFNRASGTIRVVPASGVTIWTGTGGSTTIPVSLTQNFEYMLDCPHNQGGSTPVCFLSKLGP